MTVVFSGVLPHLHLIVMTVDSAVARDFKDSPREYTTGQKCYPVPGVGYVTTWGARDHNRIGEFLEKQEVSPDSHSVNDLADLVNQYLTEKYRPHKLNLDDVGYHVAGFDREDRARLYHVFWGRDLPRRENQIHQEYKMYDHSPHPGEFMLLYNGRSDLAEVAVNTLLEQARMGKEIRFDLATPVGLACFGDFVVRFAAELTPEVTPPFLTYLISSRNKAKRVINDKFCPIDRDEISQRLKDLGYKV